MRKDGAKEDGGKGYQGQCYRCGQIGHKGWECGSVDVGEIQQQQQQEPKEEPEEEECNVAWSISAVDEDLDRKMAPSFNHSLVKTTRMVAVGQPTAATQVRNRWSAIGSQWEGGNGATCGR